MKRIILAVAIAALFMIGCNSSAVFVPEDDLLKNEWIVTSIDGLDSPFTGRVTLRFSTDPNTVSGRAACNMFTAGYNLGENSITFDQVASTKMMCPDINTETAFFSALRKVTSYRLQDGNLIFLENEKPLITCSMMK